MDVPGPVFYRQERMGLDGKAFTVYKFRSMYQDAEESTGPIWARDDDPRATPSAAGCAGSTSTSCRSSGTCCKGDMSIVGPRPERPFFVEQFKHRIPQYMLRHKVKAGHHRLGAGQRLARQHVAREAHRVRPVLHRELVGVARHQDHVAHGGPRRLPARAPPHRGLPACESSSPAPPASSAPTSPRRCSTAAIRSSASTTC